MSNVTIIIAAVILVVASPILTLLFQSKPQVGEVALVISAPWGPDTAQIAELSDVQEITPERAPLGAFVTVEDTQSIDRLYSNGAWLVINGKKVLELCSS